MKDFGKYLIWIIVLCGAFFGIYAVLPEYPHSVVKSVFQPHFDAVAKERIDQLKKLKNADLETSYGDIMEKNTRTHAWIYEEGVSEERVIFYGRGAYINIKDIPDHNDYLYTSTNVKFEFIIKSGRLEKVNAYIKGELQDEVIRDLMLHQLNSGERV